MNRRQGSFRDKLEPAPQRRMLAMDGGGIRGMISIEILARIESTLREQNQAGEDFVLADYFDYIGGTSTGAIIATCLALGMSVAEVRSFYEQHGACMFERAPFLQRFKYKFQSAKLADKLREIFGADTEFGTDKLRTLLLVVLRNATTDSPWPLSNNPWAKYNADPADPSCNLHLPLWQVVRASTAAPTFFPPEKTQLGPHEFIFVDGGVTMYNNPAWQLFLMATAEPYKLCWPTGEDRLLLVSVGTGYYENANRNLAADEMNLIYNAASIPGALMTAAAQQQDLCCRVFGRCVAGHEVDSEVGDLIGQGIYDAPKLMTYARYNMDLSQESLNSLDLPHIRSLDVQMMDNVAVIPQMQELGRRVGELSVRAEHFSGFPLPRG